MTEYKVRYKTAEGKRYYFITLKDEDGERVALADRFDTKEQAEDRLAELQSAE